MTVRPVTPPYAGWLGVDWGYEFTNLRHWDRPPYDDGRKWEVGTYPYFALRFAHQGLRLLHDCGSNTVWEIVQAAHTRLIDGLANSRYRPLVFPDPGNRSGIIVLQGPNTVDLHRHLRDREVHTALREGNIRVSPHFHNTSDDIDRLVDAIYEFESQS